MARKPASEPVLNRQQQIDLIAGKPLKDALDIRQIKHLAWRKKIHGEVSLATGEPCFNLYAVHEDGSLTYRFKAKTITPKWYVHIYVHSSLDNFKRHIKCRSEQQIHGCVYWRAYNIKEGGLLADIHYIQDSLSELVIIHESVHAAVYYALIVSDKEAMEIAKPLLPTGVRNSVRSCKEEIQCRLVEYLVKQTVIMLKAFRLPCVPIYYAEI